MSNQASEDEQTKAIYEAMQKHYLSERHDAINAIIRTEKLKLLDKFENDCKYNYTTFGNSEKMLQVSGLLKRIEAERTKLEAEL